MRLIYPVPAGGRVGIGLLVLRLMAGTGFIVHGSFKIAQPSMWMGPHGFAPPWLQAVVAVAEFYGGFALIFGFLTALLTVVLSIDMIVAIVKVHIPLGAHFAGGRLPLEVPLAYLAMLLALLFAGPGKYSIDAFILRRR